MTILPVIALYIPLAGILLAYLFILPVKLRKSPLISPLLIMHTGSLKESEFSGRALAMIEIIHWYESIIALGIIFLFFSSNLLTGLFAASAVYFLMSIVDNSFARVKWQKAFSSSWLVALILGVGNIIILSFLSK